jgi:2-amino-4-hydroxy-6-hydroxymethyldihydropteridine diphosphokinase
MDRIVPPIYPGTNDPTPPGWTRAAVAMGSNLGDRHGHLVYAVARLAEHFQRLRVSLTIDTKPVGVTGEQPDFLNAAVIGETTLTARALLDTLLAIERDRGRERPFAGAARTLDLDLILFGNHIIDEPDLIVPHPRFRERQFVLEPLATIAPGMVDPVTGQTVEELLKAVARG